MFNTNVSVEQPRVTNNIAIQAYSGGIYKSHPKSRIVRLHINSQMADSILSANMKPNINNEEIVVLQVINSVESYVLVEYMAKKDYDAENVYFNPDGTRMEDTNL